MTRPPQGVLVNLRRVRRALGLKPGWRRPFALYLGIINPTVRALLFLIVAACSASPALAQADTVPMPWLDREFRYWQGDPMMHGPNGECIAG
jgi:hypothetical protein